MKATLVFLASDDTENRLCEMMYRAEKAGQVGFEAARLPRHISLRQPFEFDDMDKLMQLAQEFAAKTAPVKLNFVELGWHPLSLHGQETGWLGYEFGENQTIADARKAAKAEICKVFPDAATQPDMVEGTYHVTLAGGSAPTDAFRTAWEALKDSAEQPEAVFDKLGIFYYDVPGMVGGTYYCFKRLPLKG